ncbi:hypothetical protein BG006_007137 [Podila minutissima]|uniref:BTB domain-containing protein n=1 Tax=Podila minutissima TaxID=64525 RepID=A0A9P5SI13_9FUNG|nr:hypothetical protein BG006_007137 [Podila minutissima]
MECIETNYGSTLVFCVDATEFDKSDKAMSCAQVKVRMFEVESPNLSNHGHWKCDLTETMQRSTQAVGLELSLQWVRHSGTGSSQESLKSNDFISQIKSIKVRSDSTLSELLVDKVDGESIRKGESIQVKLEAGRIAGCGRYKFRVSLHTQDVSRTRFLDKPLFTSFLDLDTSFDPVDCMENTRPDVCFRFPVSRHCAEPTVVCAHSSELKGSTYMLNKMAELSQEQSLVKKEKDTDHIFECTITEFSPMVFRVMLQYMYTGKLTLQPHSNYNQQSGDISCAERCHFENLYRIAERYEVQSLKETTLKAIRHTLNMSIAISLLTKISLDDLEADDVGHTEKAYQQSVKMMAMDIVKEYILFFGTEIFVLQTEKRPEDLSIRERQHMVSHLGEYVLANLGYLWSV